MMHLGRCFVLLVISSVAASVCAADVPVQRIALGNSAVQIELTPSFGGRVLALHLPGQVNLIKIGDAVREQPNPPVTPQAGDIAYLGHDVWVGPQSAWWLDQQVNPQRRAAAANWPPDPYLSLAATTVIERGADAVRLRGVDSPVSGVRLEKRFALSKQRRDTIELDVTATNIREQPVAHDLWFNTRVGSGTRVFVPLASLADLRTQPPGEAGFVAPTPRLDQGLLVIDAREQAAGHAQRGKLLLQPAAGWMAGFAGNQVLVIRFARQPREAIHPQQGQVEFYLDAPAADPAAGLLEMEVHAPYRQLAPGQQMHAREQWTVLAYDGADTAAAQRDFLCRQAVALGLDGACPRR